MRKQADIDHDFFKKLWIKCDAFNTAQAQQEYDVYYKYMKILQDEPTLFLQPQNAELSRDEARDLAYR